MQDFKSLRIFKELLNNPSVSLDIKEVSWQS